MKPGFDFELIQMRPESRFRLGSLESGNLLCRAMLISNYMRRCRPQHTKFQSNHPRSLVSGIEKGLSLVIGANSHAI